MPVAANASVFFACQEAINEMRKHGRVPKWLILGEEEWDRLLLEVAYIGPYVCGLREFQGVHVALYRVPSHLEVISVP